VEVMKQLDYLIIGQGIAGSLLAHFLLKKGKTLKIVDNLNPNSSSRVAAGIFNPITGRRFVKTWLADDIFPFAEKTYRELESEFGQQFYFPKKIIRTLSGEAELKEFKKKSERPDYESYLRLTVQNGKAKQVEILKGGNLDLLKMLNLMRKKFEESQLLIEEEFNYSELKLANNICEWKGIQSEKVIFCEGFRALNNPWFGDLPFTHAKGELLTIKSGELKQHHILSRGIFILPIGDDFYKVGSTYDWDDLSESTTEHGRIELTEKLEKLIGREYSVLAHQAGIRPTVKDRRPLIGLHPEYPQLGIFNGLGTKGVSLGPYFAHQFIEHLEKGKSLNMEADIRRFKT
jgi:glycine/D-amino acid oxidase-like deaminating enzyme